MLNMRSKVPAGGRRTSVNTGATSGRSAIFNNTKKIDNNKDKIENIEEVVNNITDVSVPTAPIITSLQYTITFEALNKEVNIPVISKFVKNYTSNQNIDSKAVFIFNVNKNEDTNVYTLMCLISNNVNIEDLKTKIIINLASSGNSVNFELINTFKASDPYDIWVYTSDAVSGNKTYYNVPNEDYANLIMKYDPFVYTSDNNFTVGTLTEETISELTYTTNDPLFLLAKNYYDLEKYNTVKNITTRSNQRNVLMVFFDQYNSWANLPDSFTDQLKGYQAFKSRGIDFTQCHNNRQMCSPSRAAIMVGKMDTGFNDNIDQSYQYEGRANLDTFPNTAGHLFKNAGYDVTCYYGKNHFDSRMATDSFIAPYQNNATSGGMREIGFDRYNELGDDFYNEHHAFLSDQLSFDRISILGTVDDTNYDIEVNGVKYSGMKPFLKARCMDNKSFHAQFHFTNPHDIMHYWTNPEQQPTKDVMAVGYPFYNEQKEDFGIDPFFYSENFPDSSIKNADYVKNHFEDNYEDYKNNASSLLYYESFMNDFAIDPDKSNSLYSMMVGYYYGLASTKSAPSQQQICFWKNFQNAYLNQIQHVDNYLYEISDFMDKNGMFENTAVLISADHGEMSASHGMQQKGVVYKNACNVPLLITSPDLDPSLIGTSNNTIVNSIDINPTLGSLSMVQNPDLKDFTGQQLLVKNSQGKLVVARNLRDENLGLLNNWMVWATWIQLWQNVEAELVNKDDICDYAENPLEYNYLCYYYRTHLGNKEYNYTISYSLLTMMKNQNIQLRNVLKSVPMEDILSKYCLMSSAKVNEILSGCISKISEDIKNGVILIYKLYESGLETLESMRSSHSADNIRRGNVVFSMFILILLFVSVEDDDDNSEDDVRSKGDLFNMLETKRSTVFSSSTPFVANKDSLDNDKYLELLYDLQSDPSESVNLLDPKRTQQQLQSVAQIKNTLRVKMINNIENVNYMSKFKMTIISPVFYNLFLRFDDYFKSRDYQIREDLKKLQNRDDSMTSNKLIVLPGAVSKAIMSLNGANNMDSRSFSTQALKIIASIRDPPQDDDADLEQVETNLEPNIEPSIEPSVENY